MNNRNILKYLSGACFAILAIWSLARVNVALFWWMCAAVGAILMAVAAATSIKALMVIGCVLRIVFHLENIFFYFQNPHIFYGVGGGISNTSRISLAFTFGWVLVYSILIVTALNKSIAKKCGIIAAMLVTVICVGMVMINLRAMYILTNCVPMILGCFAYGCSISYPHE